MAMGNFMGDLILTKVEGQGYSSYWVNFGCKHSKIFKID